MLKRVLPWLQCFSLLVVIAASNRELLRWGRRGSHGRCAVGAQGQFVFVTPGLHCKMAFARKPWRMTRKDVTCDGHGACVVTAAGKALCVCELGFRADGLTCVAVEDGGEEPGSACKDVTCGDHGTVLSAVQVMHFVLRCGFPC